jgi:hypothetical protein
MVLILGKMPQLPPILFLTCFLSITVTIPYLIVCKSYILRFDYNKDENNLDYQEFFIASSKAVMYNDLFSKK